MILLYLLLLSSPVHIESFGFPSFSDIKALIGFAYDIYGKLNDAHDTYNKFKTSASLEDIMAQVSDLADTVNELGAKLETKLDTVLDTLVNRLPDLGSINSDYRDLNKYITTVDTLYTDFQFYSTDSEYDNETLHDFAKTII